jgi:hypothetical protein
MIFRPADHIECCNNADAPDLVIGSAYSVQGIVSHWWLQLICGRGFWGVKVYGDDNIYHHSHFRPITRQVGMEDFNMTQSPFSRA